MSSAGNFVIRPPRINSPHASGSGSNSSKGISSTSKNNDPSNRKTQQEEPRSSTPQPETVVSAKKKKKSAKSTKFSESSSQATRGSQTQAKASVDEEQPTQDAPQIVVQDEESPIREEAGEWEGERTNEQRSPQYDYSPREDDDEFRNVWGGDAAPK